MSPISCRTGAWKTELQTQLCNSFGLTVTVARYPTGASKWNPIEHRLFSEISKNWAAEPLDSYPKVLNFIRNTCTRTGLVVSAYLDRRHYLHISNGDAYIGGIPPAQTSSADVLFKL